MQTATLPVHLSPKDYQQYFEKGISYGAYLQNMEGEVVTPPSTAYAQYIPMNLHRTKRIAKTLQLTDALKATLSSLTARRYWLVISEHWCGDASQTLPLMHAIAEAADGKIDLRIVYRDENPELMEAHLTRGTKSIPKLIQLNQHFDVTDTWGPRPTEAQRMVLALKSNPETAKTYSESLHKWYAVDKTLSTQAELIAMLNQSL